MEVRHLLTLIACRCYQYVARTYQATQEKAEQPVVIVHQGYIPLAERYDTRLVLTVGIVEQVFESQSVCRRGVEIVVSLVDECRVFYVGISHQTDVAIPCHATVGRVVAAACGNTSGVGTVVLLMSVRRTLSRQDVFCRRPFTADRQAVGIGIVSQLVPERLDAVSAQRRIVVEGRMSQVETYVHQPYNDALTRKGRMQCCLFVNGQQVVNARHRVHRRVALVVGFHTQHLRHLRQGIDVVQRDGDNGDVAQLGILLTAILCQRLVVYAVSHLHEDRRECVGSHSSMPYAITYHPTPILQPSR